MRSTFGIFLVLSSLAAVASAQGRPASPTGTAAIEIGGTWQAGDRGRQVYQGGKWIEVSYGRPVLRGRQNIFGQGEDYGKQVLAGAPVWRLGANVSTRLHTDTDLMIGGTRVPAGEYSLFVDLTSPTEWTLIVSNWGAQQSYNPNDKESLWGAYGYTADKDLARAKMTVMQLDLSVEQFTIGFIDVTDKGGVLAAWWDKTMVTVPFELAP
jgi:hypothetical protein